MPLKRSSQSQFLFAHSSGSARPLTRFILSIMTSNPIVTAVKRPKLNQPSTIAVVPTPDFTEPFPRSCATCDAATEAVCCHNTLTRTKTAAMKMRARAVCETAREGKGLTSTSEPPCLSACQPGKVARSRKVMKAKTMAMMLVGCLAEAHGRSR